MFGKEIVNNQRVNLKRILRTACQLLSTLSLIISLFILSVSFITGCSSSTADNETSLKVPGTSALIPTGAGYSIQVFSAEIQIGTLTLEALSDLDKIKFTADGKNEEGPTLMSVLSLVGISSFEEITVCGFTRGRLATAELTLKWAQINDRVILDFSNQGTCKLAGADIPTNDWIIDVTKMVIK